VTKVGGNWWVFRMVVSRWIAFSSSYLSIYMIAS
jgi:hypothetical protein